MPTLGTHGHRLVLSPREALVAGGPAEELEQRIQDLFRRGYLHVVVDLSAVPLADSAGLRAITRGHTTAQRLNRRFTLAAANPRVVELLRLSSLDRVLELKESVGEAKTSEVRWDRLFTIAGVFAAGAALVGVGLRWPGLGLERSAADPAAEVFTSIDGPLGHPLFELAKLVAAAIIGMLVTVVHRQYRSERGPNPMMDQAQVLLCVSGALVMIIIGNSVARAFGIAGAASIIRFRTPIEDARDITVLFILMSLGMAAGLGAFAVAGLGTLFLCGLVPFLNVFSADRPRTMVLDIVGSGRELPVAHVLNVLARNGVVFEPRELSQGDEATVRYLTTLRPTDSLEELSAELIGDGKIGIKHVSWSPPKRI
jgi:anti-anti-sigma factor